MFMTTWFFFSSSSSFILDFGVMNGRPVSPHTEMSALPGKAYPPLPRRKRGTCSQCLCQNSPDSEQIWNSSQAFSPPPWTWWKHGSPSAPVDQPPTIYIIILHSERKTYSNQPTCNYHETQVPWVSSPLEVEESYLRPHTYRWGLETFWRKPSPADPA